MMICGIVLRQHRSVTDDRRHPHGIYPTVYIDRRLAKNFTHGTNKKLKCEAKNKTMSMIRPVQSRCHEASSVCKRNLRWEGFVEKVGFEPGVKE